MVVGTSQLLFFGVRFPRAANSQSARNCIGLDTSAEKKFPSPPTKAQKKQERLAEETFQRKQKIVEKAREMHRQGISGHAIAAELHLARGTVRKYLQSEGPVQSAPRTRQPSILDPFYEYLCHRWNEENPTAHQLFGELQEKGYREGCK